MSPRVSAHHVSVLSCETAGLRGSVCYSVFVTQSERERHPADAEGHLSRRRSERSLPLIPPRCFSKRYVALVHHPGIASRCEKKMLWPGCYQEQVLKTAREAILAPGPSA